MDNLKYCSYDKLSVWYDTKNHVFKVLYKSSEIIQNAVVRGIYRQGKTDAVPSDFAECVTEYKRSGLTNEAFFKIIYRNTKEDTATLCFVVGDDKISLVSQDAAFEIQGTVSLPEGNSGDVFPVCLGRAAQDLRSAIGNGATCADHALYSRKTDMAVAVGESGKTRLVHIDNKYEFSIRVTAGDTDIYVRENVLGQMYNIVFNPVNRNTVFPTPPMGWMTWYAVKFNACEDKVLENAKWQAEHLKDFGANAIWVDWEWYHAAFYSDRADGVNSLNPDPQKYPNGMGYVAQKIKELGLVPCLWIGFTNEPSKTQFMEKYPEIILSEEKEWCGKYFYDLSNPHYLEEYLPTALEQIHKWGYEAGKYDVLPTAINQHDKHHDRMYDPTLTTKEAFRNIECKVANAGVYLSGHSDSRMVQNITFDGVYIGDALVTSDFAGFHKNNYVKSLIFE